MSVYLTSRQLEVLRLISEENTTDEICSVLGLSRSTVGVHRKMLFEKLNAKNTAGLIKKAFAKGVFKLVSKEDFENIALNDHNGTYIKVISDI